MSHNQIKTLGEIPPLEGIGLNPIYLKAFDQNQPWNGLYDSQS